MPVQAAKLSRIAATKKARTPGVGTGTSLVTGISSLVASWSPPGAGPEMDRL